MIIVSGLDLVSNEGKTIADSFIVGTSLIIATALPVYSKYVLGGEWLGKLPATLSLLLTNSVVLAVLLAIGLNLFLNIILKEKV